MAEPARRDGPESHIVTFASRAGWEAWVQAKVQDPETFLANCYAADAQIDAWEAAGQPTPIPPGFITRAEYEQQRALRHSVR